MDDNTKLAIGQSLVLAFFLLQKLSELLIARWHKHKEKLDRKEEKEETTLDTLRCQLTKSQVAIVRMEEKLSVLENVPEELGKVQVTLSRVEAQVDIAMKLLFTVQELQKDLLGLHGKFRELSEKINGRASTEGH